VVDEPKYLFYISYQKDRNIANENEEEAEKK